MNERGEYRSIYVSLFDGADFQRLGAASRLTLVTIRCTTGPCGIAVMPALVHVLAARTGLAAAPDLLAPDDEWAVPSALRELRGHAWIEQERDVVWVVRALEFEPQFNAANANHRIYVQRTWASLPRLAIRDRFRLRYFSWFDGMPIPSEGYREPIESRREEKRREEQRPEEQQHAARAKDAAPSTGTPDAVPVAETLVQTVAPSKPDDYTLACVVALNGAVERVAPSVRAVRTDQERERGVAAAWAAEGVPLALATDVIVAKVAGCDRRNPPRSLRYFDGAVREAFERTRATGGPEDQAPRVVAYANLRWRADQLLNDGRRRLVARALESFGGELSALLYAVDGLAGSAWHEKANKRTLETCFGSFGEAERFARAGGWVPGKAHAYATAPIEGRAA